MQQDLSLLVSLWWICWQFAASCSWCSPCAGDSQAAGADYTPL